MDKQDLLNCHARIKPYIHCTPVLTSRLLNDISGTQLFFKCDNFQRMGAFKMRGAANAILQIPESERGRGVVTHSSGNFAQAVSLAAREIGVPAYIVMPENAPKVKKAAVRDYGGQITECPSNIQAREDAAAKIASEKGATMLHPSNQMEVILGQGTAAMEFFEDVPDLDYLLVPVGGGGLLAGTALAAACFKPSCEVIGSEPRLVDDAYRSLQSGKIETNTRIDTLADGLRTHLGDQNFPIILKHVKQIIRVEEEEMISAMKLIWERMKIVVEVSSAVPFAAVLKKNAIFTGKKTGIIISGGNVDLGNLPF